MTTCNPPTCNPKDVNRPTHCVTDGDGDSTCTDCGAATGAACCVLNGIYPAKRGDSVFCRGNVKCNIPGTDTYTDAYAAYSCNEEFKCGGEGQICCDNRPVLGGCGDGSGTRLVCDEEDTKKCQPCGGEKQLICDQGEKCNQHLAQGDGYGNSKRCWAYPAYSDWPTCKPRWDCPHQWCDEKDPLLDPALNTGECNGLLKTSKTSLKPGESAHDKNWCGFPHPSGRCQQLAESHATCAVMCNGKTREQAVQDGDIKGK